MDPNIYPKILAALAVQMATIPTAMSAWLLSELSPRLAAALRRKGLIRNDKLFPIDKLAGWTKQDLDGHLSWMLRGRPVLSNLVHLQTCPICLGLQLSLWSTVGIAAWLGPLYLLAVGPVFIVSILLFGAVRKLLS